MRIRAKQDCFFYDKAKECHAEIHFASDLISENYPSDLIEPTNFIIKKQSCKPFVSDNQNEFVITPENTKSGLLQVVKKHRPSRQVATIEYFSKSYLRYTQQKWT
jgi:hypothetical protein